MPGLETDKGIFFDIQRAALNDGPGLRTVVFLKGCPLRCAWCHNPESWRIPPQTGRSGKVYGKEATVAQIMETVLADRLYYEHSGGGLTISGGEPTVQIDFCRALLQAAHQEGIHTCLDTCGHVPVETLASLVPLVDLFHFDIKLLNASEHQHWTGKDNRLVLENLDMLVVSGQKIVLRCPVIPGVNDEDAHRDRVMALAKAKSIRNVAFLPYHNTGCSKYQDLDLAEPDF